MTICNLRHVMCVCLASLGFLMFSCSEEQMIVSTNETDESPAQTRAVPTPYFNWENADWMPTPPGQSRIPSPWVGAGSLVGTYGLEIINDRKASDGWELLYSSFDANAPGALVNPYFVLYNKYRGNMRIFLYTTTPFVTTSTYLQDGISIVSSQQTSLLNFLGTTMVDATKYNKNYQQMQPAPADGTAPLASNRWYMMEYEMAYDPNLASIPYNNIQLCWNLNYQAITEFSFGGTMQGKLNAIMGSSKDVISSASTKLGTTVGTGVLAGVGQSILKDAELDSISGANDLGLSNSLFKLVSKEVDSAVSGAISGLPGAAINLLSALIGGGNAPKPVSYSLDANISLKGTGTAVGAFPSTPISFWVPGTNISSSAVGYIPLYNKVLGVINFSGKPTINTHLYEGTRDGIDPYDNYVYTNDTYYLDFPRTIDYSNYLIINPEVLGVADVIILKQDLVTVYDEYDAHHKAGMSINPSSYYWEKGYAEWGTYLNNDPEYFDIGVRFMIEVKPKNGNPSSTILKTFRLNENRIVM